VFQFIPTAINLLIADLGNGPPPTGEKGVLQAVPWLRPRTKFWVPNKVLFGEGCRGVQIWKGWDNESRDVGHKPLLMIIDYRETALLIMKATTGIIKGWGEEEGPGTRLQLVNR